MSDLSIDTSDLAELVRDLGQAASRIDEVGDREATRAARHGASEAAARAPRRTGELAASIHAEGNRMVASAPYAAFVEFGTSQMGPQPFMRSAGDGAMELLETQMADRAADLILGGLGF